MCGQTGLIIMMKIPFGKRSLDAQFGEKIGLDFCIKVAGFLYG